MTTTPNTERAARLNAALDKLATIKAERHAAALTPQKIVKQINAHCDKGNGIYVSWPASSYNPARCMRCFRAKVIDCSDIGEPPAAFVTPDFGRSFVRIEADTTFSDGNWNAPIGGLPITGRAIATEPVAAERPAVLLPRVYPHVTVNGSRYERRDDGCIWQMCGSAAFRLGADALAAAPQAVRTLAAA